LSKNQLNFGLQRYLPENSTATDYAVTAVGPLAWTETANLRWLPLDNAQGVKVHAVFGDAEENDTCNIRVLLGTAPPEQIANPNPTMIDAMRFGVLAATFGTQQVVGSLRDSDGNVIVDTGEFLADTLAWTADAAGTAMLTSYDLPDIAPYSPADNTVAFCSFPSLARFATHVAFDFDMTGAVSANLVYSLCR
jgi:hypothetical protein